MKKSKHKPFFEFKDDGLSFSSALATQLRMIYAPLCGPNAQSLKSSITPFLSGDIKLNKERFLTKPTSREDLREDVRNFFVRIGRKVISITDPTPASLSSVEIGPLWQKLTKRFPKVGLMLEAINFIPSSGENVELMKVTVTNTSKKAITIKPTAAVPIFARALSNKHDHEHVTSLLHRIKQVPEGVLVEHVMSFDEEGHKHNDAVYYVFGGTDKGVGLKGTFPTLESFVGEDGDLSEPKAVIKNQTPQRLNPLSLDGKEAMGALQFNSVSLKSKESASFIIAMGVASSVITPKTIYKKFNSLKKFDAALKKNKKFWLEKAHAIEFSTGNENYNSWLKWVTLQPILRRIFGCSFLPDHDYGKGGKGWRDIWQDLLSLILIEPQNIRDILFNNFAGVRIDGSNATIIGEMPGEFIGDRNKITRVWMDHGIWPLLTLTFYIDQTGDYSLLLKRQCYFRDVQQSRTLKKDYSWSPAYGQKLKDRKGEVYKGSIIEHLLIQQLVQFYNVGEHNITRLESADWNDGLDMAFERGESVTFMSQYGGNLFLLAALLEKLKNKKKITHLLLAKELKALINSNVNYDIAQSKSRHLFKKYFNAIEPTISGKQVQIKIDDIARDLREKGEWIFKYIRRKERISVGANRWFNGYYDNKGRKVEGRKKNSLRMTLTGQVFPIMSGLATEKETKEVIKAVNKYLKDKELGSIRLNTNFGLRHYLDFGRAFGFAYGTKENGAFFNHMTVMYAYALYKRGFAKEGYRVLNSIYQMANDTKRSKIYPGIPEYFNPQGRGMYHYLTGSASWLVLTKLTQVFGVRGWSGDLVLAPKLLKKEFGPNKTAGVKCRFAKKRVHVEYHNPKGLEYGQYKIAEVRLNGKKLATKKADQGVCIDRKQILKAPASLHLSVTLGD